MTDSRTPPHDVHAEEAVIGCVLGYGQTALDEAGSLQSDDFMIPTHSDAWTCIRATEAKRRSVDVLSVGAEVDSAGFSGRFGGRWHEWAVALAARAPTRDVVRGAVERVRMLSGKRKLIKLAAHVQSMAEGPAELEDVMDLARRGIADLEVTGASGPVRAGDVIGDALQVVEDRMRTEKTHSVPIGISTIDWIVGGACPGNLVVIGARPGVGKTAFIDGIAENAGKRGIPFLMFSIEMTRQEWLERMLSLSSMVPAASIRFPKGDPRNGGAGGLAIADWKTLQEAASQISTWPLYVDDRPLKIGQIVGEGRRWHAREVLGKGYQLGAIAVDYAQIVGVDSLSKNESREQKVSRISAGLKWLAKSIGCPVFLVSQLNRLATKENREPVISDLRESGAIEQDADIIILLHRELDPTKEGASNEDGPAKAIIGKNRFGKTGFADLWWKGATMRYTSQDNRDNAEPPPNWQDGKRGDDE